MSAAGSSPVVKVLCRPKILPSVFEIILGHEEAVFIFRQSPVSRVKPGPIQLADSAIYFFYILWKAQPNNPIVGGLNLLNAQDTHGHRIRSIRQQVSVRETTV